MKISFSIPLPKEFWACCSECSAWLSCGSSSWRLHGSGIPLQDEVQLIRFSGLKQQLTFTALTSNPFSTRNFTYSNFPAFDASISKLLPSASLKVFKADADLWATISRNWLNVPNESSSIGFAKLSASDLSFSFALKVDSMRWRLKVSDSYACSLTFRLPYPSAGTLWSLWTRTPRILASLRCCWN